MLLESVPGFIEVLKSESNDKRLAAVEILGEIMDPRSVEAIIDMLDDDFYYAKKLAERALMEFSKEDMGDDKEAWRAWYSLYFSTLEQADKEAADNNK